MVHWHHSWDGDLSRGARRGGENWAGSRSSCAHTFPMRPCSRPRTVLASAMWVWGLDAVPSPRKRQSGEASTLQGGRCSEHRIGTPILPAPSLGATETGRPCGPCQTPRPFRRPCPSFPSEPGPVGPAGNSVDGGRELSSTQGTGPPGLCFSSRPQVLSQPLPSARMNKTPHRRAQPQEGDGFSRVPAPELFRKLAALRSGEGHPCTGPEGAWTHLPG